MKHEYRVPGKSHYRRAISIHFLINGVGFGTWAALLPSLQNRLDINDRQLSLILFSMVIGALAAMPITGYVIGRFGSRLTLRTVTPLYCLVLCLPSLASGYVQVALAAMLFGACKGALDVCVNTHIIVVQEAIGRIILSSAQALWSIGGVVAALLTGLMLRIGALPVLIPPVATLVLLATWFFYKNRLFDDSAGKDTSPASSAGSILQNTLPHKATALWGIGMVAFLALFAEGVMMDWSAIYTERVGNAAHWLAPFAYGVFCAAMATGRLMGDRLITLYGYETILRLSGYLTAGGLIIAVLFPLWPVIAVGLLAAGLGLSNMVPIFLATAGRARPNAVGQAVAKVSMIGYTGLLAGPPVIGFLSHYVGLRGAFVLVIVMVVGMGTWGKVLLQVPQPAGTQPQKAPIY